MGFFTERSYSKAEHFKREEQDVLAQANKTRLYSEARLSYIEKMIESVFVPASIEYFDFASKAGKETEVRKVEKSVVRKGLFSNKKIEDVFTRTYDLFPYSDYTFSSELQDSIAFGIGKNHAFWVFPMHFGIVGIDDSPFQVSEKEIGRLLLSVAGNYPMESMEVRKLTTGMVAFPDAESMGVSLLFDLFTFESEVLNEVPRIDAIGRKTWITDLRITPAPLTREQSARRVENYFVSTICRTRHVSRAGKGGIDINAAEWHDLLREILD